MVRTTFHRSLLVAVALVMLVAALAPSEALAGGPYQFYALTPCPVADPRFGFGGPLSPLETRKFTVRGVCSVPTTAAAVSLNLTVTGASLDGHLRVFPGDQVDLPVVSTINWLPGEMGVANGAIVPLATAGVLTNDLAIFMGTGYTSGSVDVIIDVTGYFQ